MGEVKERSEKKRKLQDGPELEIDVSAPEPQSKKALRQAKKNKTSKSSKDTDDASAEDSKSKPDSQSQTVPPKRSPYGIWIGNMVFSTTQKELVDHIVNFSKLDESTITRVNMSKGPEKFGRPQNKGFAYVDFSTREAQDTAVEKVNETLLTGRPLLIKPSNNFEGRPEKSQAQIAAAANANPPSRRIYVGNLSYDATKESLEEHFGRCGTLTHVHVATFQDSGKCRGFAWVEFEDIAIAESAVKGYVMVKDEDEEEEESSDSSDSESGSDSDDEKKKKSKKKSKKPQLRKIWVNNHLGRRIRMEFAEDAQTRYKKRFGKDGEGKKNENGSEEQPRMRKPRKQEIDESRYTKETVQRLSGAIVEGQGKKVNFD